MFGSRRADGGAWSADCGLVSIGHCLRVVLVISVMGPADGLSQERRTTVYRCQAETGRVEFRQSPCREGRQERISIADRPVGWEKPPGPGSAFDSWRPSSTRNPAKGSSPASGRKAAAGRERLARECSRYQAKLDRVRWQLRRGYKAGKGVELRRRKREYQQFLQEHC